MLTGCTVNGTWNLVIDDDLAGDLGTLLDWSISFVCTNEIESYSWTSAIGLSSTTDSLVDASPVTTTTLYRNRNRNSRLCHHSYYYCYCNRRPYSGFCLQRITLLHR